MQANTTKAPAAIRVDLAAIFVSLELSRSKWLVTSLSPVGGERMSRPLCRGATFRDCLITSQSCNERPVGACEGKRHQQSEKQLSTDDRWGRAQLTGSGTSKADFGVLIRAGRLMR
jgi:hypothetical protein